MQHIIQQNLKERKVFRFVDPTAIDSARCEFFYMFSSFLSTVLQIRKYL